MGKVKSSIPKRRGMEDCGGVKERQHVWKLTTRKLGDPVSPLVNGKRRKGGVNEGGARGRRFNNEKSPSINSLCALSEELNLQSFSL